MRDARADLKPRCQTDCGLDDREVHFAQSVPAQRSVEIVSDVDPGGRSVASSSHAIGDAAAAGPVVELGRGLLLGGELLCAFPLPLLLPCA